jgi:Acetylornithine deacetylase/Succinyl-diaminopimelate desuccinylase and related deacylases
MALADRTLDLVNIPSVSGSEAEAYAYVSANVPLETAFDDGETLLYARRAGKPLVLLAGHLDTVPEQDNLHAKLEDGWVVGLGASDMKGGVAVMIELARWARRPSSPTTSASSSSRARSSARTRTRCPRSSNRRP